MSLVRLTAIALSLALVACATESNLGENLDGSSTGPDGNVDRDASVDDPPRDAATPDACGRPGCGSDDAGPPEPETCDGADNDADGLIDEGCASCDCEVRYDRSFNDTGLGFGPFIGSVATWTGTETVFAAFADTMDVHSAERDDLYFIRYANDGSMISWHRALQTMAGTDARLGGIVWTGTDLVVTYQLEIPPEATYIQRFSLDGVPNGDPVPLPSRQVAHLEWNGRELAAAYTVTVPLEGESAIWESSPRLQRFAPDLTPLGGEIELEPALVDHTRTAEGVVWSGTRWLVMGRSELALDRTPHHHTLSEIRIWTVAGDKLDSTYTLDDDGVPFTEISANGDGALACWKEHRPLLGTADEEWAMQCQRLEPSGAPRGDLISFPQHAYLHLYPLVTWWGCRYLVFLEARDMRDRSTVEMDLAFVNVDGTVENLPRDRAMIDELPGWYFHVNGGAWPRPAGNLIFPGRDFGRGAGRDYGAITRVMMTCE